MKIDQFPISGPLAEAVASAISVSCEAPLQMEGKQAYNHFPAMECCVLTFFFQGAVAVPHDTRAAAAGQPLPRWLLSGPRTQPVTSRVLEPFRCFAVLFYPHAFAHLTGISPLSLRDDDVDANSVLPPEWKEWPIALSSLVSSSQAQYRWITDWLSTRWSSCRDKLTEATPPDLSAYLRISATRKEEVPTPTVAELATHLRMSERHLHRRTLKATGLSPMHLHRIQRAQQAFLRARESLQQGLPLNLAELAVDYEYSDQSHLTRELRALCGLPAARLLSAVQTEEDFWPFRL